MVLYVLFQVLQVSGVPFIGLSWDSSRASIFPSVSPILDRSVASSNRRWSLLFIFVVRRGGMD